MSTNCADQAGPCPLWLDGQPVHRVLVGGKGASLNTLAASGAAVPPAFAVTSLPTNLHELVAHEFGTCRDEEWTLWALAVRPSATAEDSSDFSFAGLHDTMVDVRDLVALEGAITQCWASLWSDRPMAHRRAG